MGGPGVVELCTAIVGLLGIFLEARLRWERRRGDRRFQRAPRGSDQDDETDDRH